MNASPFSSKWLSLVMVGAITATFVGIQYYQNIHQSASADQTALTATQTLTSPLPSPPVPMTGQAVCISGIKLDNRPANNQSLSQVTVKMTDKTTHAAQIVVTNATISSDGNLHVTVPGKQLSNTDTYRFQIKPLGYLENSYNSVTNILSQCVSSSQTFRLGDLNGDGKITKADISILTQALNGNSTDTVKAVFQNQPPTLGEISRVISEFNNK